jgi:hypothetical protein
MTTRITYAGCAVLALLMVGFVASLAAQTRPGAATLDDLLAEIRGMRGDMAQSSAALVRAQLLVARIQVQEQRVNAVSRQISEVQNELSSIRQMVVALTVPLKQAQADLERTISPDVRRQMELQLADTKTRLLPQIEQAEERIQALTLRESELVTQHSGEQARWIDFNERLDALERSLIQNR